LLELLMKMGRDLSGLAGFPGRLQHGIAGGHYLDWSGPRVKRNNLIVWIGFFD